MKVLLALFVFLLYSCKGGYVLQSTEGNISKGTFIYIKTLYYPTLSNEKIIERIKILLARRKIAVLYGMYQDRNYLDFLMLEKKARIKTAASQYFKEKWNRELRMEEVRVLQNHFQLSFTKEPIPFLHNIYSAKKKIEPGSLFFIQTKYGKVSLQEFTAYLLDKEIKELLNYRGKKQEEMFQEVLFLYLSSLLNREYEDRLNVKEKDFQFMDEAAVADLYNSARYARVDKGIYPVESIPIQFHPSELYRYFYKIRDSLLGFEYILCSRVILAEKLDAESLVNALKQGKSFEAEAKKYKKSYKLSLEKPKKVYPAKPGEEDKQDLLDLQALDAAKTGDWIPEPMPVKNGFLVIQVYDVKKKNLAIRYEDYSYEVEYRLKRELLAKQYIIDKQDALQSLDAKVNLAVLKE